MKHLVWLVSILFVVAHPTHVQAQETGTLFGFVVDDVSSLPVPNATVLLVPGGGTASTNGIGAFLIDDTLYGQYLVLISAEGYHAYSGVTEVSNPIITFFNARLQPIDLPAEGEPEPYGSLAGFVVDAQTLLPLAGAGVTLTPSGMAGGLADETMSFGTFLFTNLGYGEYELAVAAAGYHTTTVTVQIASPIPETINIMMAPTQEGEPVQTGTIAGFVLDAVTFAPVAYAEVVLTPGAVQRQANGFGAFVFTGVAYGDYSLHVSADGYVAVDVTVSVDNPAVTAVEVFMQAEAAPPTGAIAGLITRDGPTALPIANATVTLMPGEATVTTNAFGAYAFARVAYGDYTVYASAYGYEPNSAGVSVAGPGVTSVDIRLASAEPVPTGTIVGMVTDAATGMAIAGADMLLTPGDREAQTSEVGMYTFTEVEYGAYSLEAGAEGYTSMAVSAEVSGANMVINFTLEPESVVQEGEGEVEGEGEDEDTPPGCCQCRDKEKSADWLFIIRDYWLLAAAMICVSALTRRMR